MEPFVIGLLCCGVIVVAIIGLLVYQSKSAKPASRARGVPQPIQQQPGGVRRAQVARGVRQRHRAQAAIQDDDDEAPGEDDPEAAEGGLPKGKVGAKKLAKMQEKAERKAQLEAELQEREERKKQQQLQEEERLKERDQEELEEKQREEQERKAREERERKEHEEYLKMKAAFSVEEEGYEEVEGDSESNLLLEFVKYIKENKVVVLEDLASQFRLKTQNVIDRIQDLQLDGTLTGVIDDRGKFIYISQEELVSVSKFVKQRGRVSITDLAEHSNNLINLNPTSRSEVCTS